MNKSVFSVCLVASMASFSSAAIVTNGSFENPNYNGGWGLSQTDGISGGWYAETGKLEIGAGSVYGVTGQDGRQVLELDAQSNAKVSQNLTTAATHYTVTFSAALRKSVAVNSQGGDILWNNVKIGSFLPASTAMQSYSFTVLGTGNDKLSFLGTGISDSCGTLIDNVSVEAVPEPTSMAALAVGAFALLRRRRQAK
jgi:hypothetical protein